MRSNRLRQWWQKETDGNGSEKCSSPHTNTERLHDDDFSSIAIGILPWVSPTTVSEGAGFKPVSQGMLTRERHRQLPGKELADTPATGYIFADLESSHISFLTPLQKGDLSTTETTEIAETTSFIFHRT